MKKVSHKKITKDCGKQLKISSFFKSPNAKKKPAETFNKNCKTKTTSSNILPVARTKLCEVDLTEDDGEGCLRAPLTPPKNKILNNKKKESLPSKVVTFSPTKKSEKENNHFTKDVHPNKNIKFDDSPDIIPSTPPQVVKVSKDRGVKRKFDFTSSDSNKNKKPEDINKIKVQKINSTSGNKTGNPNNVSNDIRHHESNFLSENKSLKEKESIKFVIEDSSRSPSKITVCSKSLENSNPVELMLDSKDIIECGLALKNKSTLQDNGGKEFTDFCGIKNGDFNNFLFDDWDENVDLPICKSDLKLDRSTRCTVTAINYCHNDFKVELDLKECNGPSTTKCTLHGSWARLVLRETDTVSILAKWNTKLGWEVTDTFGLVVLEPDTLVSSTALVGSLFCMRRAILADMFRGLDSESEIMVIGSLLHEILQEALSTKVRTKHEIESIINEITSTRNFIFTLYSSKIPFTSVRKQLDIFVPQILKFISTYIPPTTKVKDENNWNGEIVDIEDIEENIWATSLGLKGKVDVTVKVKAGNRNKVLPLELKTGRASFSSEHRGQLILYALMMTEIGRPVDSGLLLYLREGVMKEVKAGVMEKRDLILLRNELIRYTADRKTVQKDEDGLLPAPCLPDPINHRMACSKCPYATICSSALKESGLEKLSSDHPMNRLAIEATDHLKSEHIRFIFHWVGLLQLEVSDRTRTSFSLKDIWSLSPERREKNGNCVSCLKLVSHVTKESGRFKHLFKREKEINGIIGLNDYLVVSTDTRVSIASGLVSSISKYEFTMLLERDLSIHKNGFFHVDRYESENQMIFNMTNLGYLLEATPESDTLRRMLISLELPVYVRLSSEVLGVSQDLLSGLNKGQKHAVLQALASQHYLLIKGMPGTGKSQTLVSLIQLLVRLGQSVLVTSHTHSAVDNILSRLPSTIDILRLGSVSKVKPDVQSYSEHYIPFTSPEEMEAVFNKKQVVGVTCLGSGHPLLRRRKFDVVLVDEATQVLLPTTLRPLFSASRFILVGDPKQLPPLVRSRQASEFGLNQSLFSHLDRPGVTAVLSAQYRMNQCITDLANGLTYEGKLECASESVQHATIKLHRVEDNSPAWLSLALSASLEHSVVVLDSESLSTAIYSNKREAEFILQLVTALKDAGIEESQIGIIAPFQAQVALLKSTVTYDSVEISTVDTFQGRDKDIVLYSCTRSSHATETSLLGDHNRLTVAITRAKHKLIFIGDVQTLKGYMIFQKLFSLIHPSNIVALP